MTGWTTNCCLTPSRTARACGRLWRSSLSRRALSCSYWVESRSLRVVASRTDRRLLQFTKQNTIDAVWPYFRLLALVVGGESFLTARGRRPAFRCAPASMRFTVAGEGASSSPFSVRATSSFPRTPHDRRRPSAVARRTTGESSAKFFANKGRLIRSPRARDGQLVLPIFAAQPSQGEKGCVESLID